MSQAPDLHALDAQLAQRLFGEQWTAQPPRWMNRSCPAYTTDPAATAQVWQWLEGQCGYDNLDITSVLSRSPWLQPWGGKKGCLVRGNICRPLFL